MQSTVFTEPLAGQNPEKSVVLPPVDVSSAISKPFRNTGNPYVLPNDVEWIDICQEEKIRQLQQKRDERLMPIDKKQTYRTRAIGATLPVIRNFFEKLDEDIDKEMEEHEKSLRKHILNASQRIQIRPLVKESTYELIERKKNVFLVKYALQTKREEIAQYKAREMEEEKKIEKMAEQLRKEAEVFDDFLKSTDEAAVEALKVAEKETKLKIEKSAELRRLQGTMAIIRADVTRKDEILLEYFGYKFFLLWFTHNLNKESGKDLPFEAWNANRESKHKKKMSKPKKAIKAKYGTVPKNRPKSRGEKRKFPKRKSDSSLALHGKNTKIRSLKWLGSGDVMSTDEKVSPSKIAYPEEWEKDEQESNNLTEKIQYLLDDPLTVVRAIYEKEDESLRLIYRIQDHQFNLDEQKRILKEKILKKNKEIRRLAGLVSLMQMSIDTVTDKCTNLKVMCQLLGGEDDIPIDESSRIFTAKIEKVYRELFGRILVRLDGLAMLSCIEKRLHQLLDEVETFSPDYVKQLQKNREKERRLLLREDRANQQKKKQEDRLQKALERARKLSDRNLRRKLVYRSTPPKPRILTKVKKEGVCESESNLFFTS